MSSIEPLAIISQCATLKGIVFCRGVEIAHTLTKLTKEKACYTSLDKHRIHIYEYCDAIFIVFVGGRDMEFPNPCKEYISSISNNNVSVTEIVNGCYVKSFV